MKALSFNEVVIIELLACGWSARQISIIMNSSITAVKKSLHCSKKKLKIISTTRLLCYWHCELFQIGLKNLKLIPILQVPKGIM